MSDKTIEDLLNQLKKESVKQYAYKFNIDIDRPEITAIKQQIITKWREMEKERDRLKNEIIMLKEKINIYEAKTSTPNQNSKGSP